ncbi:MAG: glycoside hydrolase domain-containing protein [Bacteroidota bacterium]
MKKIFFVSIALLLLVSSYAQENNAGLIDSFKIAIPKPHYQPEYAFDSSINPAQWLQQKPGLHVSFASTDEAYFRSELPSLKDKTLVWKETGWKGERLNAIILVWSTDTVNQVRVVLHDLKNNKGNLLSKNNCKLNIVQYVISNYPYDAKEVTCGEGPVDKAWLMPDLLAPVDIGIDRFDLPGKTVRPVWISIDIPQSTAPGIYKGTIEVRSEKTNTNLNIEIKVQDQILPKPHDWTFQLDLWQNPWVIAEYYKVKPWSDEHKLLLKKHLKLYADAGGKFVTTYCVHSPWSDGSYMLEGNMIEWIKTKNGSWKFDYSIFDQYVELAKEAGIDKAITIYSPVPFGDRFRYIDENTGNYITEIWPVTSDTFRKNIYLFLTDLKRHLKTKGWLNKTYLGINENELNQTIAAIKTIKAHSKEWKITYAGDWHSELDNLLDDYSSKYGKEPDLTEVAKRLSKKQTSTFYICCDPAKPNTFVFSPPVEGRWLGWYASAYKYNGMLRWAYDAWTADPSRDARHVYWPAGDAFMVYPGAVSSVRFEKMREGISDYEKIKILKNKATGSSDPKVIESIKELNQHLGSMTHHTELKKEKLQNDILKGKKLLDILSEMLISKRK